MLKSIACDLGAMHRRTYLQSAAAVPLFGTIGRSPPEYIPPDAIGQTLITDEDPRYHRPQRVREQLTMTPACGIAVGKYDVVHIDSAEGSFDKKPCPFPACGRDAKTPHARTRHWGRSVPESTALGDMIADEYERTGYYDD
jgi:hypothetical protein